MAKLKGKIIKGQVNNMVYREYRGEQIIQSSPKIKKKNRTDGTKKAAKVFGKATKLAAEIRLGLDNTTIRLYDGRMIYRLCKEVLHCLNSVKDSETQTFNLKEDSFRSLVGFEFNIDSPFKSNLLVSPTITVLGSTLKVSIPDLNVPIELKFPDNRIHHCRIMIENTLIDFANRISYSPLPQLLTIPNAYKPTVVAGQTVEFEVAPGCLCITAITLQYINPSFAGDVILNTKAFNPAAIVHAFIAEGTAEPGGKDDWSPFSYLSEGL
jgi:hypothetical protein